MQTPSIKLFRYTISFKSLGLKCRAMLKNLAEYRGATRREGGALIKSIAQLPGLLQVSFVGVTPLM